MSSYITKKTPGNTEWFTKDRFGMFIHWGLYAMPARHEWVKLYEEIPEETREAISAFCKTNRMYLKRLQEYVGEFTKNSDGTYLVTLRITETASSKAMFEIKINLQTRADAVRAIEIWTTKAPSFYEFVYTNLMS